MAVNLASKFESKTSDLVKAVRKSKKFTNNNWSWDGVNAINVYTLTDPVMGNYGVPTDGTTAFNSRYGTATEVQDTVQTWSLARDRAWTKTIDKKNSADTMMVRKPGAYLAQATKNVLVPEIDAYIFSQLSAAGAANTGARSTAIVAAAASTSSNIYANFLAFQSNITDNEAPETGRVVAMTATAYNLFKQGGYVLNADNAYTDRGDGKLTNGQIDGVEVVIVPSSRMPANTDFIISHPNLCVAPEKLVDYTLHENAPGISGSLMEYRHRYDAFTDVNAIYSLGIHKTA